MLKCRINVDPDIAVDGWALTLLSTSNLSYASTAQTIGINCGYFMSFTVFLAFNSLDFSNKYFRPWYYPSNVALPTVPLVTLSGYLRFSSLLYAAVTIYLVLVTKEDKEIEGSAASDGEMDIKRVYTIMYRICKLKRRFQA